MFLKNLAKVINIAVITILCISCSVNIPQSTFQYYNPETKATLPNPVITDETDDYKLVIEPLGNVDNTLVFEINILNKNLDTLFINTKDWNLQYGNTVQPSAFVAQDTIPPLTAQEASFVFQDLAQKLETAENNKQAAIIAIGIILIIGVIAIAVSSSEEDDQSEYDDCYEGVFFEIDGYSENSFSHIEDEIGFYKRKSTEVLHELKEDIKLLRGESTNFELFFRRVNQMKTLKLMGGFDDKTFEWNFIHSTH
ncbi:MAG: hypothetical protein JXR03_19485 [Cyclobacteriaceae bacterium]